MTLGGFEPAIAVSDASQKLTAYDRLESCY